MIDRFLSLIAPHICCGCGNSTNLLCDNCKYDIISELDSVCLRCRKPCNSRGICTSCIVPYDRAWCVGKRRGTLQRLIGLYKFERVKSAYRTLGDLLQSSLPQLPNNVVVVPIPTVSSHIRQRGYDHTLLLARYIAKARKVSLRRVLVRMTKTKQRQASATVREQQAKHAFGLRADVQPGMIYLLIDDVVTTGATVKYAAELLKRAGAEHVWVAVLARQTLD